jgi:hypothetical protein
MRLSRIFILVAAIVFVSGSGSTRAQTPRPLPSLDGPLPVTMTGDILVNPGPRWPMGGGAPAVWVAGVTAQTWSYRSLCLTGTPDNWTPLAEAGKDGWELVGSAGIACTQAQVNGQWFILKKPVASSK